MAIGLRSVAVSLPIAAVLTLFLLTGCPSGSSIKTHPVQGKVALDGGDIGLLTGSHVELRHATDDTLRPSGKIAPGGSYSVETLYQGQILPGAPEGKYKVRISLADESDDGIPKRPPNLFHKRYLDFNTSGLSIDVPNGDVPVQLSRK
jgi:hypothetical protein